MVADLSEGLSPDPNDPEGQRANEAKGSLRIYVREAWHVVEPATPFVPGWHLDAMCEHLEAITRGEIRNLVINIPPRHMKSLTVSVFWPTWEWINHPYLRSIYSSYGEQLAVRDALKSRRLIQSPWYRKHYGDSFAMAGDQNQKTRYENDKTGYRIATGVGGMATGEGGDRLVLDDPHKLADRHSPAALESAVTFWSETMATRGNDPKTVAKVVIMQRVAEADVTADVLEKMEAGGERYEMLVLPAEHEPSVQLDLGKHNVLGWEDPRENEGDLLWPERFDEEAMANLKVSLGDEFAGQQQQRPAPAGGAIYKKSFFGNRFDRHATDLVVGRYLLYDTAHKDKESNDWTARGVFELLADHRARFVESYRERLQFPELLSEIQASAEEFDRDGLLSGVIIEDKASGISALQTLDLAAPAWLSDLLIPFEPGGLSKDERDRQAAFWCRVGAVQLPEHSDDFPWLHGFEEEELFAASPKWRDRRDTFTMGVLFLEKYLADWYAERTRRSTAGV